MFEVYDTRQCLLNQVENICCTTKQTRCAQQTTEVLHRGSPKFCTEVFHRGSPKNFSIFSRKSIAKDMVRGPLFRNRHANQHKKSGLVRSVQQAKPSVYTEDPTVQSAVLWQGSDTQGEQKQTEQQRDVQDPRKLAQVNQLILTGQVIPKPSAPTTAMPAENVNHFLHSQSHKVCLETMAAARFVSHELVLPPSKTVKNTKQKWW